MIKNDPRLMYPSTSIHRTPAPKPELQRLRELVADEQNEQRLRLFRHSSGEPWVSCKLADGRHVVPLRSSWFRGHLASLYREHYWGAHPRLNSVRLLLTELADRLNHLPDFHTFPVHRRFAATSDRLAIHLGDSRGKVVAITSRGYSIESDDFTLFTNSTLDLPLPEPLLDAEDFMGSAYHPEPDSDPSHPASETESGSGHLSPDVVPTTPVTEAHDLFHPATRADADRLTAWLHAAHNPSGACPILVLYGPPGCGKSTVARHLRSVLDPSAEPVNHFPSSPEKLKKLADSNRVLLFDHIARLTASRLATLRQLASNYQRPVIICLDRAPDPSLAARSLTVRLAPLDAPRPQREIDAAMDALRPRLLSFLYNAAAQSLALLESTPCPRVARFPEAAQWLAASRVLAPDPGSLQAIFAEPTPPLVDCITDLLAGNPTWSGAATDLLALLPDVLRPASADALSKQLDEIAPILAARSITLHRSRTNNLRTISLHQEQISPGPRHSPQPPTPGGPA